MSELTIRDTHGAAEYPELVAIWRSAVDATHDFLDPRHRDEIELKMPTDHLTHVRVRVAELDGVPVGFSGVAARNLEMLFVHADARGRGVGTALLRFAVGEDEVVTVDVNEQNQQAVGFYLAHGFARVGRSEVDGDGRPYPLVHLRLTDAPD